VKDKKFTDIQEKGIAFMIATGQYTQKEAAEKHNVAPSTIHKIYHKYKNSVENDVENGKRVADSIIIGPVKACDKQINLQDMLKENEMLTNQCQVLRVKNENLTWQLEDLKKEKTILDTDEVRLINKALMKENAELRAANEMYDKNAKENINQYYLLKDSYLKEHTEMIQLKENIKILELQLQTGETFNHNLPDNVQKFVEKCKTMQDIYAAKNIKYGNSYTKTYQEYGNTALLLRLEDKLGRAKQLLMKGQTGTADESVIDTLIDMANYAIMGVMELEKNETA